MSPAIYLEEGNKSNVLYMGSENEIPSFESDRIVNNLKHLSQEANELLNRLNELANGYPFNIIYKTRMNDPR